MYMFVWSRSLSTDCTGDPIMMLPLNAGVPFVTGLHVLNYGPLSAMLVSRHRLGLQMVASVQAKVAHARLWGSSRLRQVAGETV